MIIEIVDFVLSGVMRSGIVIGVHTIVGFVYLLTVMISRIVIGNRRNSTDFVLPGVVVISRIVVEIYIHNVDFVFVSYPPADAGLVLAHGPEGVPLYTELTSAAFGEQEDQYAEIGARQRREAVPAM